MKFSQLSNSAQEKAIEEWNRHGLDYEWWDAVYDDAQTRAGILGIELDSKRGNSPAIYFWGFSSQGDGACFEGSYRYAKGAAKAIRAYCNDPELHRIADELQKTQSRNFYRLRASMSHRGHYNHSGCMSVSVEDSENQYRDIGSAEEDITQLMRDFADWIYSQLEKEYEYLTSAECIGELLEANEYDFDENGEMI